MPCWVFCPGLGQRGRPGAVRKCSRGCHAHLTSPLLDALIVLSVEGTLLYWCLVDLQELFVEFLIHHQHNLLSLIGDIRLHCKLIFLPLDLKV